MKSVVIFTLFVVAHCAVRRERADFDCDRICRPFGYDPVCSDQNKQFDNECFLDCEWKYKGCDGRCPCNRPDMPDRPDLPNYNSAQEPQYRPEPRPVNVPEQPQYRPQPQKNFCICDGRRDPVCTTDGTEDNECIANCKKKTVIRDGPCW